MVPPGNAVGAALEQAWEALPPSRHSQPEAGNEANKTISQNIVAY
ncbi:hypothetical protein [Scytonema sp. HK-05]|nr:hypothetical protein [Scytonema sp. HK-05]